MSIPPRATPALIVFLFVLVVLVALPEGASAEGNCPPGFYPIGGQGVQGCAPISGGRALRMVLPPPLSLMVSG